jgi:hypothetical protein
MSVTKMRGRSEGSKFHFRHEQFEGTVEILGKEIQGAVRNEGLENKKKGRN